MKKSRKINTFVSPQEYAIMDVLRIGDEFLTVLDRGWEQFGTRRVYYVSHSTLWERFVSFWCNRRWTITYYRGNRR